jgi:hypothetical protein
MSDSQKNLVVLEDISTLFQMQSWTFFQHQQQQSYFGSITFYKECFNHHVGRNIDWKTKDESGV